LLCEYLVVDTEKREAFTFELPIADPCYVFFAGNSITTGEPTFKDSCFIEAGAAGIFEEGLYIGYGTSVWKTSLKVKPSL